VRQNPGQPELEETAYFNSNKLTHSYGVHLAHVAVEPDTGIVEILRYMVVEDVGRCINPLLVHGQAVGAAAQGIGGTLLEELVYGESGQLLTTTFRDYVLPSSTDLPPIETVVLEEAPSPLNPLGVKGAGEGGIVGTGAALANAASHALKFSSAPKVSMPGGIHWCSSIICWRVVTPASELICASIVSGSKNRPPLVRKRSSQK
jgi:aerobic carbon-monoxide dehydrogenase large subunit